MDIVVAKYQIESRSAEFKILDYEIASEQYGVGFAKGNDADKRSGSEDAGRDGGRRNTCKDFYKMVW